MGFEKQFATLSWGWKVLIVLFTATVLGMLLLMHFVSSLNLGTLPFHILVGLVVLALLSVTLGVLVVLVHRPIVELRQTIQKAIEGDRSVRVGFAGRNDEIGGLGSDFNQMVHYLQEDYERSERLHRAEMREAEHLATLGEVAAGLAHEIKNPLAGISGAIEIIAEEFSPENPTREVLGQIQAECDRIRRLVNDLLSYAKPKEPSPVLADLNATVESASEFGRQMLGQKELRVETRLDRRMPPILHDPQLIREVVVNLLLNSIHASKPGESIVLLTRYHEPSNAVEVVVRDHGRGIPKELLPRVFQPFFTTKGSEGTGLGLSLAKRIVEQHGGAISALSVPGEATEFTVRLPAQVSEAALRV